MMADNNRYIGITIGPIFSTINLSSSPAALWASSYMFSSLTRIICEILTTDYSVSEEDIVSPYYAKDEKLLNKNDGIGLFHDHIIFRVKDFNPNAMEKVRSDAIDAVVAQFGLSEYIDFFKEYIQISWVLFEGENPIKDCSQALDCLELAKPFVFREEVNPLINLFTNADGREVGRNAAVIKLTTDFDKFQLLIDNTKSLKSLEDITNTGTGLKKYRYYAIVRADGDKMGSIIGKLKSDSKIRDFSKACLTYCSRAAELVENYDGITIYSGGDDLLAIMPCESRNSKSVFEFALELNKLFADTLTEFNFPASTLSIGISIAYHKSPLYEVLSDSDDLLFQKAKKYKNCVAVNLSKHSGQSEGLIISNDSLNFFIEYMGKTTTSDSDALFSAMHKLSLFSSSFSIVDKLQTAKNLFKNTFDANAHKSNHFVTGELPTIFWNIKNQLKKIYVLTNDGISDSDPVLTTEYILRIFKFFIEKEGERE